jgi:hypothetical protein
LAMRRHNGEADRSDSFIAPDLILPSQFFEVGAKRRFSCEQRLMLAVLVDAINIPHDRPPRSGCASGGCSQRRCAG